MTRPPHLRVRAPAKVNLCLAVGAPGDDGFHPLATVYQAVGLYDEVAVSAAPIGEVTVAVSGDDTADVPVDDRNLAVRAARLLLDRTGVVAGAHLDISKAIPVAGGMAGGSADAAATLVACDALWGTALSAADLYRLAAEIGSDVPFSLLGGTAIGSGRGERVTPALSRGHYRWVVALAHDGLSTATVYAETDRLRAGAKLPEPSVPTALMDALRAGDAWTLGAALSNDLQPAALSLRPALAGVLARGESAGALGSMVSGSGPTCAFLARDDAHALDIAGALTGSHCCRSVQRVTGPTSGPRAVAL